MFSVLVTLFPIIKKWRESLNSGGNFGALYEAFGCLFYNILIAQLHEYGLD